MTFRKAEDAARALAASKEKVFFGSKVIVTTHEGFRKFFSYLVIGTYLWPH